MGKELTEQWQNGTLPEGYYYTQYNNCSPFIYYSYRVKKRINAEKTNVLSAVPSYREYNDLKEDNKYLKSGIETRDKQIEQLLKKLETATKALEKYTEVETYDWIDSKAVARKALKEMEGVK